MKDTTNYKQAYSDYKDSPDIIARYATLYLTIPWIILLIFLFSADNNAAWAVLTGGLILIVITYNAVHWCVSVNIAPVVIQTDAILHIEKELCKTNIIDSYEVVEKESAVVTTKESTMVEFNVNQQYVCPNCAEPIQKGTIVCPKCGQIFAWDAQQ